MLQTKKQITINGASVVSENDVETTIATMFASLTEAGKFNINKTIVNNDKYAEYATDVNADLAAFDAMALEMLKED